MKSNQNQPALAGQNDPSAATSRENLAPAPHKEPASGELAAALCSALVSVTDKQDSERAVVITQKTDGLGFKMYGDIKEFNISRNILKRMI